MTARQVFERAFPEYGLLSAIRTDNGVPFATQSIHGLSYLNVWWVSLDIQHQRIHLGKPQENGAQEQMHRTLKLVRGTCAAQQKNFDAFRHDDKRRASARAAESGDAGAPSHCFPKRPPEMEYPLHFVVKKATTDGTFCFRNRVLYLANVMVDQQIGLEETDDGQWEIYFNTMLRATLDERNYIISG